MKRFVIALSCLVASCATNPLENFTGITYDQVKAKALQICHYEPSVTEVTKLIPYFTTASLLADGLCSVVVATVTQGARQGFISAPRKRPVLYGVPLQGHFVNP